MCLQYVLHVFVLKDVPQNNLRVFWWPLLKCIGGTPKKLVLRFYLILIIAPRNTKSKQHFTNHCFELKNPTKKTFSNFEKP